LEQLFKVNHAVLNHYKSYDFTKVFHALADYCAVELSAFYLDIIKDRLYTEKAHGHARRSAQTVCWYILDTLTKLIAPVMSFTAEQLSDHYQKNKEQSIHLQSFNSLHSVWELLGEYYAQAHRIILPQFLAVDIEPMLEIDARLFTTERETQWLLLKEIRSALLKALEVQREKGMIKHSLEARLTICIDTKYDAMNALEDFYAALAQSGQRREDFFKEFLIVSQVRFVSQAQGLEESELQGLWVRVEHAHGQKCPRCWQWQETENQYNLCDRCQEIVK
jgi:isoleucyl-tRNA synthetase